MVARKIVEESVLSRPFPSLELPNASSSVTTALILSVVTAGGTPARDALRPDRPGAEEFWPPCTAA